ncbi:MAG: SprT-like domain-containing protein, partial [Dehalococcoidia bacterium]
MARSNPADTTLLATLQAAAQQIAADHTPDLPPLTVRLSARLTRSAGTYRPPGTITISRHFLAHHGFEAVVEVLRHEVAHHVVCCT